VRTRTRDGAGAAADGPLRDPLLEGRGIEHAFGLRDAPEPAGCLRARQVHGATVARVDARGRVVPGEADAVLCERAGVPVGVVTADCVPVLLAGASGHHVAAVHAGWRGLAAGVVEAAASELAAAAGEPLVAAVGPHIRVCCYEVDAPVVDALTTRFGAPVVEGALQPSRPGHHRVDLEALALADLARAGLSPAGVGTAAAGCTACDAERFHSYRRDGEASGRMLHWVTAGGRG